MPDTRIVMKISDQQAAKYPAATNLLKTGSRKKTEMILTVLESLCEQHGLSGTSPEHINLIIGLSRYGTSLPASALPLERPFARKAETEKERNIKKAEIKIPTESDKKKPVNKLPEEPAVEKSDTPPIEPDPSLDPVADPQPSEISIDGMPDGLLDSMGIDLM